MKLKGAPLNSAGWAVCSSRSRIPQRQDIFDAGHASGCDHGDFHRLNQSTRGLEVDALLLALDINIRE